MAEKLLLHLHFECTRHKVNLPWDAIAHRLHPGSSGAAIVQHLNRVRKELIREGHLVPPICQKPSSNSNVDPTIRGYVRQDTESNDKDSTRPVRFDEKYDDLKFNLPDSFEHSGDEDYSMPDSPSPQRTRQLRYFSRPPSTTDESMTNSIHGMEQSVSVHDHSLCFHSNASQWSPQSSTYCSPTRQRRADIEDYEVPALNRSFDTVTSVGSAPTSAPSMSNQWQELPWPQYSPMSLYPYSKDNSTVQSPFPGYFTLPSNFSMFPADDPMSAYREAQEARVASLRTYEETEGESPDAEKEDGDLKIETQFTNVCYCQSCTPDATC